MATFVRQHKSAHKKTGSPLTPASDIIDHKNMYARQLQLEYTNQHSRWSELRDKMKSMQLNRIQVTSYRNRNSYSHQKHEMNMKSQSKLNMNVNNKSNKNNDGHQNQLLDKLDLKQLGTQRIFSSRSRKNQKRISKDLPYYQGIYRKQDINKSETHLRKGKKNEKQASSRENPQYSQNINQQDSKQLPPQYKIRSRHQNRKKQQKYRHCHTSASQHKINNSKLYNDLIYFNKIEAQDYTSRMIVRRKSNVIGDCIQAIQASILRSKIILFIADITSGSEPSPIATTTHRLSHKHLSTTAAETIRQKSQANNGTSSSPFQTYQCQLMLGPNQINQYLEIVGLSAHPVELESSTVKLASILVDFLIIESKTLRLDKNQISHCFVSQDLDKKQERMKQAEILLNKSQLVRLLNPHHRKRGNKIKYDFTNNHTHNHNLENSKQKVEGMDYYKIYGHPHPVINSRQCQQIIQFESHQNMKDKAEISQQIIPNNSNIKQNPQIGDRDGQNNIQIVIQIPNTIEHQQNQQIVQENSQLITSEQLKSDRVMQQSHIQQMKNSSIKQQNMSKIMDETEQKD